MGRYYAVFWSAAGFWAGLASGPAWAKGPTPSEPWVATPSERKAVITSYESKRHITGLVLEPSDLKVEELRRSKALRHRVEMRGTFTRPERSLTVGGKIVPLGAEGKFTVAVELDENPGRVDVLSVGPRGDIEVEKLIVQVAAPAAEEGPIKRWSFSTGLGGTFLSYGQSNVSQGSGPTLTLKASAIFLVFTPNWDVSLSGFVNLIPVRAASINAGLQFLGLNARVGYALPFIKAPWRLSLMAGLYYTTVLGTQAMGYQNLFFPHLYPTLRRTFNAGDSAFAYLKYTPVDRSFAFFSTTNLEIGAGGGYGFLLKDGNRWTVFADFQTLKMTEGTVSFTSTSVTLGTGYDF